MFTLLRIQKQAWCKIQKKSNVPLDIKKNTFTADKFKTHASEVPSKSQCTYRPYSMLYIGTLNSAAFGDLLVYVQ